MALHGGPRFQEGATEGVLVPMGRRTLAALSVPVRPGHKSTTLTSNSYRPAKCFISCSHETLLTHRSLSNRESESFGRDFRRAEGSRGVTSGSRICAENERLAGAGGAFRNAAKNRDPTKNAERDTLGVLANQTVGESSLTGFSSPEGTLFVTPRKMSRLF